MKNFLKKFSNSLISGIGFGFGFLMIIGLYIAYATGVFNLPSQVGTGSGFFATEWNKMVGSLDYLKNEVDGIKTAETWKTSILLNGWVNYGGVASTAGYYKDGLGIVHLKGLVKNGTILQNIFVLPIGYRPLEQLIYSTDSSTGTYVIGRVDVKTDGSIYPYTGGNSWFSLDGLSFRAEQ
ncbi:hypothetical protein M0P65_05660 [Candidatus Gracilibacteria bacterium]|nr:hypothetical protein [Candidatus Gracilibacteria bacterium]